MSGTRLVDIILERRKANRKHEPWPASREELLTWLREEPNALHRQTFLNDLHSTAPDWLSIVQDHLSDFIGFLPPPITHLSLSSLHIWVAYHLHTEVWRNTFWQHAPEWFSDPHDLLRFLRQIPSDHLNDSLKRAGMGAALKKLSPRSRHEWMVDLFATEPDRLLHIDVIVALLSEQSPEEQKNVLMLLKNSYLKMRPLQLETLGKLLSTVHAELFPLFREEFDALFSVFTAKQYEFRTEQVLNFLSLLETKKHQAFFEIFQDQEIQWWISGLAFTPTISDLQKQLLVALLLECSNKHNLAQIIQLRCTFIYLLQLAHEPLRLSNRLTDQELHDIMLGKNTTIAEAVREIVAMNLKENITEILMQVLTRVFTYLYGEKTSFYAKFSSTFYKTQYELDRLALGNTLHQTTPSVKLSG